MQILPDNAIQVTKACLVLHNIMRARYPNLQNEDLDQDANGTFVPGSWRNAGVLEECELQGTTGERSTRQGRQLRQYLTHYVNSDAGRVTWQEQAIM